MKDLENVGEALGIEDGGMFLHRKGDEANLNGNICVAVRFCY